VTRSTQRKVVFATVMTILLFLAGTVGFRHLLHESWNEAFYRTAITAIALPYIAATAGWVLTEMGRQPWIVQGLLLTSKATSPSVSTTWLGISLGFFVTLYVILGIVDFVLMRRYARPEEAKPREELAAPAVTY